MGRRRHPQPRAPSPPRARGSSPGRRSDTAPLAAAGVVFEPAEEVLGSEALAAVEAAPRRWARVWARLPLADGRSFRDLVSWRGESLLWAAEGFLREATAGPRCARSVELCLRLFEQLAPAEVDASGLGPAETALVARAATACGVLFHGQPGRPRALPVEAPRATRLRERLFRARPALPEALAGGAAAAARARPALRPGRRAAARAAVRGAAGGRVARARRPAARGSPAL